MIKRRIVFGKGIVRVTAELRGPAVCFCTLFATAHIKSMHPICSIVSVSVSVCMCVCVGMQVSEWLVYMGINSFQSQNLNFLPAPKFDVNAQEVWFHNITEKCV